MLTWNNLLSGLIGLIVGMLLVSSWRWCRKTLKGRPRHLIKLGVHRRQAMGKETSDHEVR